MVLGEDLITFELQFAETQDILWYAKEKIAYYIMVSMIPKRLDSYQNWMYYDKKVSMILDWG